jgi:hypothetical protein
VTKRHRSGTTWTELDYASAGYGTIKLRLDLETLERLRQLSEEGEESRAAVIRRLVACAKNTKT